MREGQCLVGEREVYEKRARLLKNSLVPRTGPRFGCREPVFGPFEPGLAPPIGSMGSFSTASSVFDTLPHSRFLRRFMPKTVSHNPSHNQSVKTRFTQ